jgi:hypothetical protein
MRVRGASVAMKITYNGCIVDLLIFFYIKHMRILLTDFVLRSDNSYHCSTVFMK